jgi:O-antigen ligase
LLESVATPACGARFTFLILNKFMKLEFRVSDKTPALGMGLAAVCLYLIFSPVWMPDIAPRQFDNARYLQLGLLAVIPLLMLNPSTGVAFATNWMSLSRVSRLLVATLLCGGALSALWSPAPKLGALEVGVLTQLVVLLVYVAAAVRELGHKAQEALATAVFVGGGLLVLQFWVTWGSYLAEGKAFPWVHPFLEFANVRFFSQYQAYALLLMLLPIFLFQLKGCRRGFILLLAAAFWSLQWMVGTRSVWVGLAVAICVILLCMRAGRREWFLHQAVAMLAGGLICLVYIGLIAWFPDANPTPRTLSIVDRGWESTNIRFLLASSSLAMIREFPILGVGPGQFGLFYSLTRAAHPHNTPLQLLSEYGLIAGLAGIALLLMLAWLAVRALRNGPSRPADLVGASLSAALVMGLIDSLFSGNLIMPHAQILFCVVGGWLLGRSQLIREAPRNGSVLATRLALTSLALAAALTTLILGYEYWTLVRVMPFWQQEWVPHFWQYGRFHDW